MPADSEQNHFESCNLNVGHGRRPYWLNELTHNFLALFTRVVLSLPCSSILLPSSVASRRQGFSRPIWKTVHQQPFEVALQSRFWRQSSTKTFERRRCVVAQNVEKLIPIVHRDSTRSAAKHLRADSRLTAKVTGSTVGIAGAKSPTVLCRSAADTFFFWAETAEE